MPHSIILGNEILCIVAGLMGLHADYEALKAHRAAQPEENSQTEAMDDVLHDSEHFVQNLCQGDSLNGYSIASCRAAIQNLLP